MSTPNLSLSTDRRLFLERVVEILEDQDADDLRTGVQLPLARHQIEACFRFQPRLGYYLLDIRNLRRLKDCIVVEDPVSRSDLLARFHPLLHPPTNEVAADAG